MPQKYPSQCEQLRKPSNWPEHVRFIQSTIYHASVPSTVRQYLQTVSTSPSGNSLSISAFKNPKIAIRRIQNASHPAFGQFGLFAAQRIPPNCHILQYIGEVHCDDRPDSEYDLSLCRLPEGVSVGIDASKMGNQARFVNDYRGVARQANAVFVDGQTSSGEFCMSVWSFNREIKKGEEILVSYGKSWWQSRCKYDADIQTT